MHRGIPLIIRPVGSHGGRGLDRLDTLQAIHDYLAEDLVGFHGSNRRTMNGELFFDVVEFTLKDGSSVVVAEDSEGDIHVLTTSGSPSNYRH